MDSIILLTKNVQSEASLVEKLQVLGYEVFCTSYLLEEILQEYKANYLPLFEMIVVSSSVSDDEVKQILKNNHFGISVYRIDALQDDQEIAEWKKSGLTDFFSQECTVKDLRELLAKRKKAENLSDQRNYVQSLKRDKPLSFELFLNSLSAKEQQIFEILVDLKGRFIQRKDLSERVFGSSNSSCLAQLSQIVNRIRQKINSKNPESSYLITNWGKGYALSESFFLNFRL
ncbi:helix-turn-helix domain-containing protein [Enterococcus sp. ALS3]|uniref:Helix-turn-helix domain-containing protein n=1 Tax=Enterococcus alishanensis TaxID=1303817 RepID=A0ABS6TGL1_9ENTE|nr:helix-turn-helix domain-containing protein [Enterococcus alishanensis]MBV7392073.1 helix-turn-helix domain-containing protein [Enterococcus alishanensis]